jgi:hypothetical protein
MKRIGFALLLATAVTLLVILAFVLPAFSGEGCGASGSVDCCTLGGTAEDDIDLDGNAVCGGHPATDVPPGVTVQRGRDALATGSTATGGDTYLIGGEGRMTITVDTTGAKEVGVTVTQICHGIALAALVEGVDYNCSGLTNAVCATNLAAAIQAQPGSCVTTTSNAAVVYPQPIECGGYGIRFSSANGAGGGTAFVVTNGADGAVILYGDVFNRAVWTDVNGTYAYQQLGPDGTSALPTWGFYGDPGNGFYLVGPDAIGFATGTGLRMSIDNNGIYGVPFFSSADGTAGACRFSWQGDEDLGLYRVGANELGLGATSGVDLNGPLKMGGQEIQNVSAAISGAAACTGDALQYDSNGVQGCPMITDSAPQDLIVHPESNYPAGTQAAANLILRGGIDEKTATVATAANCATNYLKFSCGLSDYTLTENTDWHKVDGDNDATAASLLTAVLTVPATCIDAIHTTRTGAAIYITPSLTAESMALSTDDATCLTVTNGTDGKSLFTSTLAAQNASGPELLNVAASSSLATVVPNKSIPTYGLSCAGTSCYLILNGTQYLQLTTTAATLSSTTTSRVRSGIDNDTGDVTVKDNLALTGGGLTKGALLTCYGIQQNLTFAANPGDASKTTSGLVPDGAMLMGIVTRVTTTATNCTSVNIGDGTDPDMFAATSALIAGTTTDATNATAQYGRAPATAAMEVTVTGVGGNCYSGVWRVTAYYCLPTADTAN